MVYKEPDLGPPGSYHLRFLLTGQGTLAEYLAGERERNPDLKAFEVAGITVWAFRISYVGEQGFELYFDFDSGLPLWDQLFALGVVPIGVETYANSRR
mgnify:CR=1 FL=1